MADQATLVTPRHSVSVAAAVVREDGRVLAIRRRDNGAWEPPGGVLELEETITEGLRREVREETGLEIGSITLTGVYKNMPGEIVALVFRCVAAGGALRDTDETAEARWLDRDEVQTLMQEAYAVRLLDALEVGPPAVRAHDGIDLV